MSLNGLADFVVRSEVRAKVLEDLLKGPKTPTELAHIENAHISHISRTLAELKAQGLVTPMARSSRERYYKTTQRGLELSNFVMRMVK